MHVMLFENDETLFFMILCNFLKSLMYGVINNNKKINPTALHTPLQ